MLMESDNVTFQKSHIYLYVGYMLIGRINLTL